MAALTGLPRRIVEQNLVTARQAQEIIEKSIQDKTSFVAAAVASGQLKSRDIALLASEEFGLPVLDISAFDFDLMPQDLVSRTLIEKHRVLPLFQRGNRLFVAQSDPSAMMAIDEIKFNTGMTVEATLVEEDKLSAAVDRYLSANDNAFDDLDGELDDVDLEDPEAAAKEQDANKESGDDAPIVRFVNKMLLDAIKGGSSDIHFEPYEKRYRVRYRTDGLLHEVASPPINLAGKIAARLKVMSRMDISERRIPQDGRIKMKLSKNKAIDFRVNTLPTLWGEKIVLRILDPSSAKLGIDMLGYEPEQKDLYMEALSKPQGMILVTGPTGSGKTVSLYTGLNILNVEGTNISTAEDPVEINLEGINQVNVNAKVGLDFAAALRSFLRQDPDVVMVGEIRDLDTASIAIKAAQTGHLVLSTLHTNSAAETLTRLANMGVPSFNIATSVTLIIAQRLARRLCPSCKEPADLPQEALIDAGFSEAMLASAELFKPVGCDQCKNGYKGRVGIYEVVKITDPISRIIMEGGNSIEISDAARKEGFHDLRVSALQKVAQGVTSLEEANRVTTD
ncbi:MAG: type IV-A pilus assembly ATPase PilB [Oceanospirillaceae bacterium]|uniref:type IV-A pilus assembly ATPase PilB n=1 Tax=unclassified Thalassolituus TaxID=2624967 RepID=UPI000C5C488E|nr:MULTISPECIES: type IV-A pilus assembly ATPase PilB [unclassified Thalassolituus]MAS24998.1 type IV-A pilus assembly ATPase PilB [Oceanospirillaceae bacterium]MAX98152.1 type IV-A pilus assembly ATPase PilB [Oceanospirillaceae bacterium]MBL34281.1 type IV-A pilus assembly ATPase PilB [Oceanospirillaceae bacterium]MBS52767.1 type IV-A pilus assembly ATPase PilB [Oceanospirillaceae bacterium]